MGVLYVMPFPKNIPTDPEFNPLKGTGAPVANFDADRETLLHLLEQLHTKYEAEALVCIQCLEIYRGGNGDALLIHTPTTT